MKQVLTYLKRSITVCLCIAMLSACSGGDDIIETILTVKDFETTIEENPTEGQGLGVIEAAVNQGTLVYSLMNESSAGTLAIDDKGNLTVKDASLFDYETLQKITATVQIKSGEIIKEVLVNVLITNVDECIVFKDANFKQALLDHIDPVVDTNDDGEICETEARVVKKLLLDKKEISDLYGLEFFTILTELNCSENNFTTLDLSKNTVLTKLGLQSDELVTLDLSKNIMLTELLLRGSANFTTLDLSKNTILAKLMIGSTHNLRSLNLSKNTMLTELILAFNSSLTSLDLSKNTALTNLFLALNKAITSLDVSKNTTLTVLNLTSNEAITSLDLSKNIALTALHFKGNNGLTSLDLSKNTALTSMSLWSNNNLTSLNLKNGNNAVLEVSIIGNMMKCIEVDDPKAEYLNNWAAVGISYSSDCSL